MYQIYADEGITGTSTQKRIRFHSMINDAYAGRFELIITKEVSRFSRNLLDTIAYTRELKALGVGVLFMVDNINTLDPDAELRLSIMASLAQEESRKTSEPVKWGQTRQMERGVVFGRSMLGYDVINGKMTLNPDGAEIVKLIYHKYGIEKKGTSVIARELREAGYRTYSGAAKWSSSHIVKILKNEKYVGDLIQKKTYTADFLTHQKKINHGEVDMIVQKNHHEPIIERDLWELVQRELAKRSRHGELGAGHSNRYAFSGKIKCGACGSSFVSRKRYRKDGSFYRRWSCFAATTEGRRHVDLHGNEIGCDVGRLLRDDTARDMVGQALGCLDLDPNNIVRNIAALAMKAIRMGEEKYAGDPVQLKEKISQTIRKKEDALDAYFSGTITREEMAALKSRYDGELADLAQRLSSLEGEHGAVSTQESLEKEIQALTAALLDGSLFSEAFIKAILGQIIVHRNGDTELTLKHLPHVFHFDY